MVKSPGFHHGERGFAHAIAGLIETGVFACLTGVGFDLADAGDVVVEQGIQRRDGFALRAVAGACGERVGERSGTEEWNGNENGGGE